MKTLYFGVLMMATVVACDDSEELTCEVLASPDFCWTVAVTEAYACNTSTNVGDLSEDGKTCEFDTGTTATFTPALEAPFDIKEMTIAVSNADGQCAKLVDDHNSTIILKTKSGTVDVHVAPTDYSVECPNGTTYATDKPLDLLSCGGGLADNARLPGTTRGGAISFGITPRPTGAVHFIDCAFPAAP